MGAIEQIAFYLDRRDEVPNQVLAAQLAETEDRAGLAEIAAHLHDRNPAVASDCLKVLYETGYLKPALIEEYAAEFLELLKSKNNRMVWGAMIALSTIAARQPRKLWDALELILDTIRRGSVITEVYGIKTLVQLCTAEPEYRARLIPILLDAAASCRPNDFPSRVENLLPVMDSAESRARLLEIIATKQAELKPSARKRLSALERKLNRSEE